MGLIPNSRPNGSDQQKYQNRRPHAATLRTQLICVTDTSRGKLTPGEQC